MKRPEQVQNPISIQIENMKPFTYSMTYLVVSLSIPLISTVLLMIKKEKRAVMKGLDRRNHILGSLRNCFSLLTTMPITYYRKEGLDPALKYLSY